MTREEAIRCLSIHSSTNGSGQCTDKQHYEAKKMAIKVLKQEPCTDAVSRKDVINAIDKWITEYKPQHYLIQSIRELPSINPQPCDDAISREDAINTAIDAVDDWDGGTNLRRTEIITNAMKQLPSVNPQYTGNEFFNFDAPMVKKSMEQDAISRSEAVKAIEERAKRIKNEDTLNGLAGAVGILFELPPVTQKSGKWIPVSERLPKDSNYYLCCGKDGYMIIGWISKWSKEWCFDDDEIDMDVVAWMPLPQPYKAESEDRE